MFSIANSFSASTLSAFAHLMAAGGSNAAQSPAMFVISAFRLLPGGSFCTRVQQAIGSLCTQIYKILLSADCRVKLSGKPSTQARAFRTFVCAQVSAMALIASVRDGPGESL